MSLSSFGSSPNYGPQYSIRKTSMNVHEQMTGMNPNVMPGIPFYVSTDLNYQKRRNRVPIRDLYQIEIDVAKQYLDNLKSECHREKQRNKRFTNKDNHSKTKCDLFYKHLDERKEWEKASEFSH